MMDWRRKHARVSTLIPVEWDTIPHYRHSGSIVSLSAGGCLIKTPTVEPLYGKTIYVRAPWPDGEWTELRGEVIYYVRELGFGMEFADLSDGGREFVNSLMQAPGGDRAP